MNQRYQGYPHQPAPQQNNFVQESYQTETPPFYPPNNYYPNYASEPPQQTYNTPIPAPPPPPPVLAQPHFVRPPPNLPPHALPRFSDIPPPPPPGMGHIQQQSPPFRQPLTSCHFPTSGFWRAPLLDPTTDTKQGTITPNTSTSHGGVKLHEIATVSSKEIHAPDNAEKENSVKTKLKGVEDAALGLVPPELQGILKELMQPLFCKLCNAFLNAPNQAQQHYSGKTHAKRVKLFLKEVKKGEPAVLKPDVITVEEEKAEAATVAIKPPEKEMKPVLTDSVVAKDTSNPTGNKMVTAEEYCDLCDASFNSPKQAEQHYKGKNHAKKLRLSATANVPLTCDSSIAAGEGSKFTCFVCNVHVTSQGQLTSHLNGSRHKNKLRVQQRGSQALRGRWPNKQGTGDRVSCTGMVSDMPEGVLHCDQKVTEFSPGFSDWQHPSPAKKTRRDFSNNRTPSGKYYCSACNVTLNAEGQFAQHVESKRHKTCSSSQRNYLDCGDPT